MNRKQTERSDGPQEKIGLGTARRSARRPRTYRLFCIASYTEHSSTFLVAKIVLIADDSAFTRLSVRMLLEGRHTELLVCEAVDGVDAIQKAKTSKPDLIILDLAMPRLNGAEAAAVLKNEMPDTPVILFTLTDLHIDTLCTAIDVDLISKVDGIPSLLERVDALFPPNAASQLGCA
jgi:CheY-like chemotaxis protein